MPRAKSTGLNTVRGRRKPDGSRDTFYYERASGRFLSKDRDEALAMLAPKAEPQRLAPASRTFADLVERYYSSTRFAELKPRTRELYRHNLNQIMRKWGAIPVRGFDESFIEDIKDDLKDQPAKCNNFLRNLRMIFAYARKPLLWVDSNPFEKPGLSKTERKEIWDIDVEAKFLAAAPPRLRLAYYLLMYTGQRLSDVLAMTTAQVWARDDGRLCIGLRQQKTGELLELLVHQDLLPLVEARLAESIPSTMLVPSPRGLLWTRRNFSKAWDAVAQKVGIKGEVQRRDLRRSAVVHMAVQGLQVPMIAAVTGHSIDATAKIIETYLPRRAEVAAAAIEQWESAPRRPLSNIVKLAARRAKP